MNEFSQALSATASAMKAQAQRIRHITENIANADTPGYRRKITTFDMALSAPGESNGVRLGPTILDQSELAQIYDPAHPMADEAGYFTGSNVNLVIELADAREAQRSYEANLKMFDQTRQMARGLMELLRK